jgi:hypothetical protein
VPLDRLPEVRARVQAALAAYKREMWAPWALDERPRRQSIELYNSLFSLRQMLDGAGDQPIELVWGIGIANWPRPRGTLRYPLLTLPVELALNEATHAIELRPRSEAATVLESDALDALDVSGVNEWRDFTLKYLDSQTEALSPFEPEGFAPILRRAVALLDPDGHYLPDVGERPAPGAESLRVDDKWVLFERPRRATHLMDDLRRFAQRWLARRRRRTCPPLFASCCSRRIRCSRMSSTRICAAYRPSRASRPRTGRAMTCSFRCRSIASRWKSSSVCPHGRGSSCRARPGPARHTPLPTSSATIWPKANACW